MPDAEIQEILSEIAAKKAKANESALEFRRLYRESQEAYADEDKELAKQLSEEGHETQDECEALNQEVKDLYEKLKGLNEQKKRLVRANVLPTMALKGIPPSFQQAITDTLKSLPSRHVSGKVIERMSYSGEYKENPVTKEPQQANTDFSVMGGKPVIRINKQTREGFTEIEDLKIAMAHEVGHVVYRKFVTDEQKADWAASFTHTRNDSEDSFVQCYAFYYLYRDWLSKEHPRIKQFFDGLNLTR